jgi:NAD(P)-dependent dehydrogenase (short-subunit alcohol dehydrogenase family)
MAYTISLAGKAALVTGASSGLGVRFATLLAEAGAAVALCARRTDRLKDVEDRIVEAGGRAVSIGMDVTDVASIRSGVAAAEAALGPIGILINNSGVSGEQRLTDVDEATFDRTFDTNVRGAFFVAQTVAASMIRMGTAGRIVNVASIAGLKPFGRIGVYSMSKAAVVMMTRSMAIEWARHGINVNAICPGYVETEINAHHWATEAGQKLVQMLPRRRIGRPEDLDAVVMMMVSDGAHFVNGAIVAADDGMVAG